MQDALKGILTDRSNDSRYDSSFERITEFKFATEADSLSAFDAMMAGYSGFTGYEAQLDGWFAAHGIPHLGESKERIALISLAFNGAGALLGPKLAAALKSDDRAEAWYEIRYRSNADGVQANRRYKESDLFGLYGENPTEEDYKAGYRMYTRHRNSSIYGYDGIVGYEAKYKPANAVYDGQDVPSESIEANLEPAHGYLVSTYGKGVAIAWDHIFVGEDANTVYFRGKDADAGHDALKGTVENDLIFGESGNDEINGDYGSDVLYGGTGNDTLDGGVGDDILVGGSGKDVYILRAGGGNDRIYDEDGVGAITFIDNDGNRVTLSLSANAVPGEPNTWRSPYPGGGAITYTLNSPLTIHLPDGSTMVVEDFSNGQLGIDLRPEAPEVRETVVGGVGDEFLYPESYEARHLGNAKVEGQAGHDALSGTLGADSLDGGEGNDAMSAGLGDDRIIGGAGNDVIDTGPGKDIVEAGEGDDLVTSSFAIDIRATEVTAQGNVIASLQDLWRDIARHYQVTVINPDLPTAAADGYLHWGFNPSIGAEPWTETLPEGRVYDEVAYVPETGEGVYGGTLTYRDKDPDPLSRLPNRVYRINFPYVAQPNADPKVLYGGAGNDRLLGADVIYGEADQDRIEGGAGADLLFGGSGDDQLVAGADDDYVSGDTGNDKLWGESGSDRLYGGEGNDYIEGDSGANALYAQHGNDVIDAEAGDDTVFGQGGNDILYGGDGNDRLWGNGGNDTLYGGDGDDHSTLGGGLVGGAGNDTLFGEAGRDELQGGAMERIASVVAQRTTYCSVEPETIRFSAMRAPMSSRAGMVKTSSMVVRVPICSLARGEMMSSGAAPATTRSMESRAMMCTCSISGMAWTALTMPKA